MSTHAPTVNTRPTIQGAGVEAITVDCSALATEDCQTAKPQSDYQLIINYSSEAITVDCSALATEDCQTAKPQSDYQI